MFWQTLMLTWTVLCLYAVWRAGSLTLLRRPAPRRTVVGLGLLLWASAFAARAFGHDGTGALARVAEITGMTVMATLFLVALSLLLLDLLTGFGLVLRGWARELRGWATVGGLVLAGVAAVQGLRAPVVRDYEVDLAGLPPQADGTVLVAVSDLHLGATLDARWLAARVAQVKALHPDAVVLLGDIFEGHGDPPAAMLETLGSLSAPLGVWAVTGNHEYHGGRGDAPRWFETAGAHLLRDEWSQLRPGLVLAGVDDLTSRRRRGSDEGAVRRSLEGRPPGGVVLLSHTPWQVEEAARAGAGLMLSGHTHGGQVWPFGYLVRTLYPYLGGRYQVGAMTLIVCRGTGTWGPRMRLWRPSEILRVTLRSPR